MSDDTFYWRGKPLKTLTLAELEVARAHAEKQLAMIAKGHESLRELLPDHKPDMGPANKIAFMLDVIKQEIELRSKSCVQ